MKIGYLTDSNGRLTNLANAIRLEIVDGAKEIIPLAYGKLSDIPRLDILVGKNFLQGEILFLRNYAEFLIDGDRLASVRPIKIPLKFNAQKAIYLGLIDNRGDVISLKDVSFTFPFPFRDSSFNSAIIFEILDLDVIREVSRILKPASKAYMVLRDEIFGGVNPLEGVKRFSAKFKIVMVKEAEGFWIIEGIKIK
ncbi:hypothetical protein [Saccharolobus caldissimus]|uniref:Uncharacterized protein n=1 Tax=Saccharolobus caldissimus TaxID=1702097 RepID=A0AAQ4CQ77_9CREN|nr:hypothetical protein [Saccharolobus caldissimus]BDB97958.1 hypothetical protein SACC_09750 [Saccharolobus caldissimus]